MPQSKQNPSMRRAYVVRPTMQLFAHLQMRREFELAETLSAPTIVMTESLPYEEKLESYRSMILGKCKNRFVSDLREFLGDEFTTLLGDQPAVTLFDSWWLAEEADTIELVTDW